ncbi:hypothetical protein D3C73_1501050 [compost metagenome]
MNLYRSGRGLQRAGKHFEQGRFPGAVLPDDAYGFTGADGEVDVFQYPVFFTRCDLDPKPAADTLPFTGVRPIRLAKISDD